MNFVKNLKTILNQKSDMETNTQNLSTICVTDNEITQLHRAFGESINGNKENLTAFREWIDGGNFPIMAGYLITVIPKDDLKVIMGFDISDIRNIKIQMFQTRHGKDDCYLSANVRVYEQLTTVGGFQRYFGLEDHMDIEYLSLTKAKEAIVPYSHFLDEDESKQAMFYKVTGSSSKLSQAKKKLDIEIEKASCKHHAIITVNALLVLMYHMAQNKPTYLTAKDKTQSIDSITIRPYKYDGYIDLRKTNKVYTVSTDKNGDVRKFTRHIESWKVIGHSRTYKKTGKTIWIGEQVRGQGALEERTYATVDKSELDLKTKVFNVPSVNHNIPKTEIETITESVPCQNFSKDKTPKTDIKVSIFKRIANKFKSWF